MTLGFKKQHQGEPTYFAEKIWEAIDTFFPENPDWKERYWAGVHFGYLKAKTHIPIPAEKFYPKIHTIREDLNNRWKPGSIIHPVINNRTPDRYQFAPQFPCVSFQEIEIQRRQYDRVWIDGCELDDEQQYQLALNDGFNSKEDFFKYFKWSFKGKIIHFTNFKYFGSEISYDHIKNACRNRIGFQWGSLYVLSDEDDSFAVTSSVSYDRAVVGYGGTLKINEAHRLDVI